jgi:hypothetical protein
MSDRGSEFIIITLAIVYLPLLVADIGNKGGGIWKFLSFVLCTIALGTAALSLPTLGASLVPGVIAWLFAWACAAAARSAARRDAHEKAVLAALHERPAY